MARAAAVTVHRTAGAFSEPGSITSAGGLVQRGSYMQGSARAINIMSRPRIVMPLKASQVGGKEPKLPKGMD